MLQGSVTVGYLHTVDQVVCLVSQGQFSQDQLSTALRTATEQVTVQPGLADHSTQDSNRPGDSSARTI